MTRQLWQTHNDRVVTLRMSEPKWVPDTCKECGARCSPIERAICLSEGLVEANI